MIARRELIPLPSDHLPEPTATGAPARQQAPVQFGDCHRRTNHHGVDAFRDCKESAAVGTRFVNSFFQGRGERHSFGQPFVRGVQRVGGVDSLPRWRIGDGCVLV
ncbi:MAG: hypothetical protein U1F23_03290 [Lysobacterales bacterium]